MHVLFILFSCLTGGWKPQNSVHWQWREWTAWPRPDLSDKIFAPSPSSIILSIDFCQCCFLVKLISLYSCLPEFFHLMNEHWISLDFFLCCLIWSCDFVLSPMTVLEYSEPDMHPRNKPPWSEHRIIFIYCWIPLGNIFLRICMSICIRCAGLSSYPCECASFIWFLY